MKNYCFVYLLHLLLYIPFLYPQYAEASILKQKEVHIKDYVNEGEDITSVLQNLIEQYSTIVIDPGVWYISPWIELKSKLTIKGADRETSILKRVNSHTQLQSGFLFYTDKTNIYVFTQNNIDDNYDENKVNFYDIHFENLTIDFNRNPSGSTKQQIEETNLFGIVFSHCRSCSIDNCKFIDHMNKETNSGCPAVVFFQSKDCRISNCYSEKVTMVKSIYSENVTIDGNYCINSVGTCIESVCGKGCTLKNNFVKGVLWDVSCVGVNTTDSKIYNNVVISGENNISCLTLGHKGFPLSAANNTVVKNNHFKSEGVRSILLQNGSGVIIRDNELSCVLNQKMPASNCGCIVARGESMGISNLLIERNLMVAYGDIPYGVVTYAGSGNVLIRSNSIQGKRGISFLAEGIDAQVRDNDISCSEYSVSALSPNSLYIVNNVIKDGIMIKGGETLYIKDNTFESITHASFIYGNWNKVIINDNVFNLASSYDYGSLFIFNAKGKDRNYSTSNFMTKGNILNNNKEMVYLVNYSYNDVASQLIPIVFNDKN